MAARPEQTTVRRTRRAHGLSGVTPGAYQVSPHGTACAPRRFALHCARTTGTRRDALPQCRGVGSSHMTGDNLIDLAVEAVARIAAREARQAYRREVRLGQRNDTLAATIGAGPTGNRIATALAGAYLAVGEWRRPALTGATRAVLGTAPRWIYAVLDEILDAYHRPPTDRPREFARFIARLRTFRTNVPGAPGASPKPSPYGSTPARSRRPPRCGGRSAHQSWTMSPTWRHG